jgi:hypothetical protein
MQCLQGLMQGELLSVHWMHMSLYDVHEYLHGDQAGSQGSHGPTLDRRGRLQARPTAL